MKCSKCGSEMQEDEEFCNNCGGKINYENQNNNEYESRLAQANNAAELFLSSEKPTSYDYQVVSSLYGKVEEIGAHKSKTYISELNFYVKANLLNNAIFVTKINQFEKIFDNLMKLALLNCKSEKEKEAIQKQFNKDEIIQKVTENINNHKILNTHKKKYALYAFLSLVIFIIIVAIILNNNNNLIVSDKTNNETIINTPIETYIPNQAGIFRNEENVIEEKFDKNNNITYYKTKNTNGTINEETFTYEYDNKNRLTRMANSKGEYILINYNKDNQIASVINSYGSSRYTETNNYFYKGNDLLYKIKSDSRSITEITYYQSYEFNDSNYVLESTFIR